MPKEGLRLTIKQIAVAVDGEGNETLYALTEAGCLFEKKSRCESTTSGANKKWFYWWEEVNLPVGEPQTKE